MAAIWGKRDEKKIDTDKRKSTHAIYLKSGRICDRPFLSSMQMLKDGVWIPKKEKFTVNLPFYLSVNPIRIRNIPKRDINKRSESRKSSRKQTRKSYKNNSLKEAHYHTYISATE